VLRHPAFAAGDFDTGFIERHRAQLLPPWAPAPREIVAAASLTWLMDEAEAARAAGRRSGDPHSPWHRRDFWRLNGDTYRDMLWRDGESERRVRVYRRAEHYRLEIDGEAAEGRAEHLGDGELNLTLDGACANFSVLVDGSGVTIIGDDGTWRLAYIDPLAARAAEDATGGRLVAPMPGKVVQVLAAAGGTVKRGQALMVLEAMKMEHTIAAPADGTVERVNYAAGDLVEEGAELIAFSATAE
jgi:3-methylcrotonyl-CoA carboxylase alpha subunit